MRYTTTAYCDDSECRCLDRNGVVLYDGPSQAEAERAAYESPVGYSVEVIESE